LDVVRCKKLPLFFNPNPLLENIHLDAAIAIVSRHRDMYPPIRRIYGEMHIFDGLLLNLNV
jgi:hypothetical protein